MEDAYLFCALCPHRLFGLPWHELQSPAVCPTCHPVLHPSPSADYNCILLIIHESKLLLIPLMYCILRINHLRVFCVAWVPPFVTSGLFPQSLLSWPLPRTSPPVCISLSFRATSTLTCLMLPVGLLVHPMNLQCSAYVILTRWDPAPFSLQYIPLPGIYNITGMK